jgi:hypothetical protein
MRRGGAKDWTDAAESDLGITLLEGLAYVADVLSHYQDEIAAEARLETRRRTAFVLLALVVLVCWRRRHVERCISAQ